MTNGNPDEVYSACYAHLDYRTGAERLEELEAYLGSLIADRPLEFLDVGCGRGESLELAGRLGFKPLGMELPGVLAVTECPERRIPITDIINAYVGQAYDIVGCQDVLEHIPEPKITEAIRNLWDLTRFRLHLSVSCVPEKWGPAQGFGPLHVCLHPPEWWREKVLEVTGTTPEELGGLRKSGFYPMEVARV